MGRARAHLLPARQHSSCRMCVQRMNRHRSCRTTPRPTGKRNARAPLLADEAWPISERAPVQRVVPGLLGRARSTNSRPSRMSGGSRSAHGRQTNSPGVEVDRRGQQYLRGLVPRMRRRMRMLRGALCRWGSARPQGALYRLRRTVPPVGQLLVATKQLLSTAVPTMRSNLRRHVQPKREWPVPLLR